MKTHNGRPWPEHWSLQLHFLWKELQLGGLHENSYWPPMACILIPTTALSVERASAGRTSWKLILAAHGGWSLQLQCMWKKLQLGALHENSCSPPSSKRKAWLENTPFALSNFSRTGWVYTGSSRIYSKMNIMQCCVQYNINVCGVHVYSWVRRDLFLQEHYLSSLLYNVQ